MPYGVDYLVLQASMDDEDGLDQEDLKNGGHASSIDAEGKIHKDEDLNWDLAHEGWVYTKYIARTPSTSTLARAWSFKDGGPALVHNDSTKDCNR